MEIFLIGFLIGFAVITIVTNEVYLRKSKKESAEHLEWFKDAQDSYLNTPRCADFLSRDLFYSDEEYEQYKREWNVPGKMFRIKSTYGITTGYKWNF